MICLSADDVGTLLSDDVGTLLSAVSADGGTLF